jgi:hypothetical protein
VIYTLQYLLFGLLGEIQFLAQLQIHPKSGLIAEIFGETKCNVGADLTSSVNQIIDTLVGKVDHICQIALGELQGG